MPEITIAGLKGFYEEAGEGFSLLLLPPMPATIDTWKPYMPLFGELCRTFTYAPCPDFQHRWEKIWSDPASGSQMLQAFLQALKVPRIYLVSPLPRWQVAWHFAWQFPALVEGLFLVAIQSADKTFVLPSSESFIDYVTALSCTIQHQATGVPTFMLSETPTGIGDNDGVYVTQWTDVILPQHADIWRQVGQALMQCLMRSERQRNLVRGASFLL